MPQAKGTLMLPIIKGMRVNRALVEPLLPARLKSYLSVQIIATEWYPCEDQLELFQILGRAIGVTRWENFGAVLASEELTGVYRALLFPGDGERTLRSMPHVWRMNFDSGTMSVVTREGAARLELEGFGVAAEANCQVFAGYVERALEMAGMRRVAVTHPECTARGAKTCVWDTAFDAPAAD